MQKSSKNLNYVLKDANDEKLSQREEKYQVLDFQERMEKTILKLATLKRSTHFSMQQLIEEEDEALNVAKDNGTTETIEELDKLSRTLEEKMWFLQLIFLVILDLYQHMYQVWIHPELQVNNSLGLYKNKGGQHLNKLKPCKIIIESGNIKVDEASQLRGLVVFACWRLM